MAGRLEQEFQEEDEQEEKIKHVADAMQPKQDDLEVKLEAVKKSGAELGTAVADAAILVKDKTLEAGAAAKNKVQRRSVELASDVLSKGAAQLHKGAEALTPTQKATSAGPDAKIAQAVDKMQPEDTLVDKIGAGVAHGVEVVAEATGVALQKGSEVLSSAAEKLAKGEDKSEAGAK